MDDIKGKNNNMDITDSKLCMEINSIFPEVKPNRSSKFDYIQNNLEKCRQEAEEC